MTVRVGIVGSGFMGRTWAEVAAHHAAGTSLSAVTGGRRAPALATDFGIPLEPSLSRGLEASLRQLLGGEPQLESAVRPELIGGVVLRVGDTVYDGSVARQLEQVREQMITRSVHEIQSRRDRFRHPGGN